jgi:glycosyltransferase involved in cell wall biosynthesis
VVGEAGPDDRDYQAALAARASRLGLGRRVIFAGLRTDVPALLAASTVSVMPSLNEALSNVLLESMAAGAPTVATRVGGTPEAMDDGVTGLLVPPEDAAALAEAVGRLIDDPARAAALGGAARETVERRFSLQRMVDDTERLYLSLLRQARVRTAA